MPNFKRQEEMLKYLGLTVKRYGHLVSKCGVQRPVNNGSHRSPNYCVSEDYKKMILAKNKEFPAYAGKCHKPTKPAKISGPDGSKWANAIARRVEVMNNNKIKVEGF